MKNLNPLRNNGANSKKSMESQHYGFNNKPNSLVSDVVSTEINYNQYSKLREDRFTKNEGNNNFRNLQKYKISILIIDQNQ